MSSEMALATLWVLINFLAVIVLGSYLETPDDHNSTNEDWPDGAVDRPIKSSR